MRVRLCGIVIVDYFAWASAAVCVEDWSGATSLVLKHLRPAAAAYWYAANANIQAGAAADEIQIECAWGLMHCWWNKVGLPGQPTPGVCTAAPYAIPRRREMKGILFLIAPTIHPR